jgi:TPR repeat protein
LCAEQGNVEDHDNFGACFSNDTGIDHDWIRVAAPIRLFAEQGDSDRQPQFGHCFANGVGVDQDGIRRASSNDELISFT